MWVTGGDVAFPLPSKVMSPYAQTKTPLKERNAVHLSGAALRSTGNRVFEIFTVLGLEGLGR
jgi:hypothetical protein